MDHSLQIEYEERIRHLEAALLSSRLDKYSFDSADFSTLSYWNNKDKNDLPGEIWRIIPGFGERYQASSFGRIKSLFSNKKSNINAILSQSPYYGYLRTYICGPDKQSSVACHKLIASAFLPNPENKPLVNHINSIRSDNRVINLEWCTYSENTIHSFKHGNAAPLLGSNNGSSKLNESQVMEIFNSTDNIYQLAIKYGVSQPNISCIKTGKSWSHLTKKKYEKEKFKSLSVDEIISIYISLDRITDLAKKYNVSSSVICNIKSQKTYQSITANLT